MMRRSRSHKHLTRSMIFDHGDLDGEDPDRLTLAGENCSPRAWGTLEPDTMTLDEVLTVPYGERRIVDPKKRRDLGWNEEAGARYVAHPSSHFLNPNDFSKVPPEVGVEFPDPEAWGA